MNIAASFEARSDEQPNAPAILFESEAMSYRALREQASRLANVFRDIGVRKGDRIALFLPNVPAFAYCYLGVVKTGAIVVSIHSGATPAEIETILRDSGASVLISEDETAKRPQLKHVLTLDALRSLMAQAQLEAMTLEMERDDPAAILYTSGTTGTPKGAMLSHGNVLFTMAAKRRYLGLSAADRMLLFLPLHHCFAQNAIMNSALGAGASVVLHRGFDVDSALRSIAEDRVTVLCGVPTTFRVLYEKARAEQLAGVRCFFSAAAPLPEELEARWEEKFGKVIHQGYGLTETSPFASYNHLTKHKRGSIGVAIEGVEMKVVDVDTGAPVAGGEKGEIAVRGENVMLGYWNRAADTAQAIRDGWFYTGDIGRMDAEGYLYVEDRLKDMIIVGGSNVYSTEVENVLLQHAAVSEAAVFGIADAVLGERVKAAVVLKAGRSATEEELIRFCAERISRVKIPAAVEFLGELPRNRAGKVLKRVLREQQQQGERELAISSGLSSRRELERNIVQWLSRHLYLEERQIDIYAPFAEYGLNSMLAVALAEELSRWTGNPVTPTITWHFSTVSSLAARLMPDAAPLRAALSQVEIASLSEEEAERQLARVLEQLVS
jgi:long-chain acyl-CoA synthetase